MGCTTTAAACSVQSGACSQQVPFEFFGLINSYCVCASEIRARLVFFFFLKWVRNDSGNGKFCSDVMTDTLPTLHKL